MFPPSDRRLCINSIVKLTGSNTLYIVSFFYTGICMVIFTVQSIAKCYVAALDEHGGDDGEG